MLLFFVFIQLGRINPLLVLSYLIVLQSDPGDESDKSPACSGSPAELTGPSGEFGISKSQYKNKLQCGWKITVEAGKVIKGSVPLVFICSL